MLKKIRELPEVDGTAFASATPPFAKVDPMAKLVEIQKKFGPNSKEYQRALEEVTGISDDDGKPSDEFLEEWKERNRG